MNEGRGERSLGTHGWSRARTLFAFALLALVAGWLAGLTQFVRHPVDLSFQIPVQRPHPQNVHNLALYLYGPRLRASSYDHWADSQHHPAFLVDGLRSPSLTEKWASRPADRAPWIEIHWNQPATLHQIVIQHAGARESRAFTTRRYTLRCLFQDGTTKSWRIENNTSDYAKHDVTCQSANGIRLDLVPNSDKEVVRVFEVEAWGRFNDERAL